MNIWVNGCFDILHTGHIDLFWFARLYETNGLDFPDAMKTNRLHVGVDTDERVKLFKGEGRPINNVYDRVKMLSNLVMINNVVMFHDDEELRYFVKEFDIDYLIVGDHYKDKDVIGEENSKFGVVYFPTDKRSSSTLIEKIINL